MIYQRQNIKADDFTLGISALISDQISTPMFCYLLCYI